MLSNIRGKLLLITLLGSMTALFTLALGMYAVRDSVIQERLLTLEQITDVAHGLIEATYSQVQAGELTKEEAMERLEGQIREMRFEEDGYFFIYDFDGVALIHATKPQLQGKNLIDFKDPAGNFMIRELVQAAQSPEGRGTVEYLWPRAKGEEPVEKLGHVRAFAPWRMAIGTGIYIDDINSIVLGQVATLGALVLLLCGIGFAFSWRIASGLSRRVHSLNDTMGLLAQGRTDVEIDTQAAGELGEMARSVEVFRRNALEREALEAKQAELKAEAEQQRKAAVQRVANHLEARIGQVAGEMKRISEQLGVQVGRLNDATGRTHDFAQTVSGASQIAASNVEMVAASTQELDASSREINQQMERSAQLAAQAAESAEVAGGHLTALSEATQNVDSITHVISEVAEQTSLLALNATIEAARAGEAGKGFAVVADEVKGLAGQTKSAVDEIGAQIAATQQTAQRTVSSMGEISGHIYDVRDASTAVAAAVTEQGSAISEITRNIEAVSGATHNINDTIQRLVDEMSQSQTAVKDVEQVSGGVREVADQLEQAVLSVVQELRSSL